MTTLEANILLAIDDVCPSAPPGMEPWADTITGWVKWTVIAGLGIAFFVSLGLMLWGKFMEHHKSARIGVTALITTVVVAIILVGGFAIINEIVGTGCGGSGSTTGDSGVHRVALGVLL